MFDGFSFDQFCGLLSWQRTLSSLLFVHLLPFLSLFPFFLFLMLILAIGPLILVILFWVVCR